MALATGKLISNEGLQPKHTHKIHNLKMKSWRIIREYAFKFTRSFQNYLIPSEIR